MTIGYCANCGVIEGPWQNAECPMCSKTLSMIVNSPDPPKEEERPPLTVYSGNVSQEEYDRIRDSYAGEDLERPGKIDIQ